MEGKLKMMWEIGLLVVMNVIQKHKYSQTIMNYVAYLKLIIVSRPYVNFAKLVAEILHLYQEVEKKCLGKQHLWLFSEKIVPEKLNPHY